jgi:hypothetical protein
MLTIINQKFSVAQETFSLSSDFKDLYANKALSRPTFKSIRGFG